MFIPISTDQSFVRQLMLGTEAAKGPNKSITSLNITNVKIYRSDIQNEVLKIRPLS
jgi:hypothetical protein